jgi:hypothetical protein
MRSRIYKTINHLSTDLKNWSDLYNEPKMKRMNTEQPMEDRLWEYIDGRSGPTERSTIEELLVTNREWREKYKELLDVHQLLNASELDAPSMRFTRNVMEEIARYHVAPATRTYINKNVIRGIGAFFLTLILGFTAYVLSQFRWISHDQSTSSSILTNNPSLGLDKINSVDISKYFNTTYTSLFMLISVIMGFVLLDMYLQRRRQGQQRRTT